MPLVICGNSAMCNILTRFAQSTYRCEQLWCWEGGRSQIWVELNPWAQVKVTNFHWTQFVRVNTKNILWLQIPVSNTWKSGGKKNSVI